MPYELKSLSCDPAKLTGLSEKLIVSHWENNYGGAVRALNTLRGRLAAAAADANTPPFVYTGLKREQLLRTGSVVLHELYFAGLGGNGQAGSAMRSRIAASSPSHSARSAGSVSTRATICPPWIGGLPLFFIKN